MVLAALPGGGRAQSASSAELDTVEKLGSALFFERNLSFSRKQNCASCHSPELAFTDPRALGDIQGAVSRGGDGRSFGDRNAPTLGYVALAPEFHLTPPGDPVGGMFWDGRARDIESQIHDPLINPVEMAMPDAASVVARVNENPAYRAALAALFGEGTLSDTKQAFAALEKAIAAFMRQPDFAPFDSKYDRSLRGEATLSAAEAAGRDIFFSSERAGCNRCHAQGEAGGVGGELLTTFRYYNLGVPANTAVRKLNNSPPGRVDHGVLENAAVTAPRHDGAFKVPTLRNVAVTGPYMHNGVFQELRTAVLFHLRFSARRCGRAQSGVGEAVGRGGGSRHRRGSGLAVATARRQRRGQPHRLPQDADGPALRASRRGVNRGAKPLRRAVVVLDHRPGLPGDRCHFGVGAARSPVPRHQRSSKMNLMNSR